MTMTYKPLSAIPADKLRKELRWIASLPSLGTFDRAWHSLMATELECRGEAWDKLSTN